MSKEKIIEIPYDATAEDFYFAVQTILDSLGVVYEESGVEVITIKYKVPKKDD